MKVIDFNTITNLKITPLQCYQWVEEVICKKKNAILPPKISMKPSENVFYNVMPSILPEIGCAGAKVVTRYPSRNPSLDSQILLYNLRTGEIKAILDGNYITAMRTGAVAAHSIQLFGKKDFKNLGFMGLGNTARATMKVLLALYPEREFVVRLLAYKNQHEFFEEMFQDSRLKFVICNTPEEVVRESDVIVSAVTVFAEDVCDISCFPKGCLVVPIHTRGFANCDLSFDKIFADDTEHVRGFKNFKKFSNFAETTEVVNKVAKGRETEEERILAYNIGVSIHDIYFAEQIWSIAKECQEVDLLPPKEQFWV